MSNNNQYKGIKRWLAATLSTIVAGVTIFYLTEGMNRMNKNLKSSDSPNNPIEIDPSIQTENTRLLIRINVSGMSNIIRIEEGNSEFGQDDFNISGTHNSRVFFISRQQYVKLNVSGVSNTIYLSRTVSRNIEFINSGVSNQLIYH